MAQGISFSCAADLTGLGGGAGGCVPVVAAADGDGTGCASAAGGSGNGGSTGLYRSDHATAYGGNGSITGAPGNGIGGVGRLQSGGQSFLLGATQVQSQSALAQSNLLGRGIGQDGALCLDRAQGGIILLDRHSAVKIIGAGGVLCGDPECQSQHITVQIGGGSGGADGHGATHIGQRQILEDPATLLGHQGQARRNLKGDQNSIGFFKACQADGDLGHLAGACLGSADGGGTAVSCDNRADHCQDHRNGKE